MYDFNYHKPDTVADAVALFNAAEDAMYLAGGHTLIPAMKQRLRAPTDPIDLSAIQSLGEIQPTGGSLLIGTTVTHRQVAGPEVVSAAAPRLADPRSG